MLDLNGLKRMESGWQLSSTAKARIIQYCETSRRPVGRHHFDFSVLLRGAAGVLAVGAAIFALLLFWPTPKEPEEVVVLPGSSTPDTAKPADVVPDNTPDNTQTTPQPEQKPAPETPAVTPPPAEDEKKDPVDPLAVHRFWETVPEMSLEEAIPIVEEKLTRVEDPLTDKERMAFYVWTLAYYEAEEEEFSSYNHYIFIRIWLESGYPATEAEKFLENFSWGDDGIYAHGSIEIEDFYFFRLYRYDYNDFAFGFELPNGLDKQVWEGYPEYCFLFKLYKDDEVISCSNLPKEKLLRYILSKDEVRGIWMDLTDFAQVTD